MECLSSLCVGLDKESQSSLMAEEEKTHVAVWVALKRLDLNGTFVFYLNYFSLNLFSEKNKDS